MVIKGLIAHQAGKQQVTVWQRIVLAAFFDPPMFRLAFDERKASFRFRKVRALSAGIPVRYRLSGGSARAETAVARRLAANSSRFSPTRLSPIRFEKFRHNYQKYANDCASRRGLESADIDSPRESGRVRPRKRQRRVKARSPFALTYDRAGGLLLDHECRLAPRLRAIRHAERRRRNQIRRGGRGVALKRH